MPKSRIFGVSPSSTRMFAGFVTVHGSYHGHSRAGGNPALGGSFPAGDWIPAFAGMPRQWSKELLEFLVLIGHVVSPPHGYPNAHRLRRYHSAESRPIVSRKNDQASIAVSPNCQRCSNSTFWLSRCWANLVDHGRDLLRCHRSTTCLAGEIGQLGQLLGIGDGIGQFEVLLSDQKSRGRGPEFFAAARGHDVDTVPSGGLQDRRLSARLHVSRHSIPRAERCGPADVRWGPLPAVASSGSVISSVQCHRQSASETGVPSGLRTPARKDAAEKLGSRRSARSIQTSLSPAWSW